MFTYNSSGWDSNSVYGSSLLNVEDSYLLWYTGKNNLGKRQIGYTTSNNPNVFNIHSENPIESWNQFNVNDVGVEHPSIVRRTDNPDINYQVWFDRVLANFSSYYLYTSFSLNGKDWSMSEPVRFTQDGNFSWESSAMTAPSVLFVPTKSEYYLFYTANGEYNGIINWRIAVATSSDAITWTKHSVPVLEATEDWEHAGLTDGIGNPTVVFENGIFHMWYHSDLYIGYAISIDGIKWYKSPDNPVITNSLDSSKFDYIRVMDPNVLKGLDNHYSMYYTGVGKDGKWQIGLAMADALPTPFITIIPTPTDTPNPTPTDTPTPTPTPSSTPTPTFTPAPTPTAGQAPFSPIIIVPGMGSTWNPQAIFTCSLNTSSGWSVAPYVNIYRRLINTLTNNAGLKMNKDVYVYTYDWRQSLDWQGHHLKEYIDNILKYKPAGTKVRLIGHSLGGLVIRSYLESYPDTHRAESVLTAGTPHQGTILAYPIWEAGVIWTDDKLLKIGVNAIIESCRFATNNNSVKNNNFKFFRKSKKDVVHELVPSIQDILPIFDYLKKDGNLLSINDQVYKNDWLLGHAFSPDLYDTEVFTLSGKGDRTLRYLGIKDSSVKDKNDGDWLDGYPQTREYTGEGDGTVLDASSMIEKADNMEINGSHSDVVSSKEGIQKILDYLRISKVSPANPVSLPEDTSKSVMSVSLDKSAGIELVDPQKSVYKSDQNLLVVYDPLVGVHRLKIEPSDTVKTDLRVSLMDDKDMIENSLGLNLRKNKTAEILLIYTRFGVPRLRFLKI